MTFQAIMDTVGMELLIFAVTLIFAMLIKLQNKNQLMPIKLAKSLASPPRSPRSSKRSPSPLLEPSSPTPSAASTRASSGASWQPRGGRPARVSERPYVPSRQMQFAQVGGRAASQKEAWRVAEEIIHGAKEHPGPVFANRAFCLHNELRVNLRDRGVRLIDVPWYSKTQPTDLYATLVQCAIRIQKPQLIAEIVQDMVQQGVTRTLSFYENTMKQLAGQKQYHLALRMYDRLVADGFEASAVTLSCLISFAAEVGELERATGFFWKLRLITTPSIRAYMTVLRIHAKRQDWPSSMETLRDMQKAGVPLDSIALNVIFLTGVAADRLDEVEELLADAVKHEPPLADVVSYNTLIKGYANRGNGEAAAKAIRQMRELGLAPNAITFNTAMDASVRSPKSDSAWRLLGEMRRCGIKPDKFTCSILVKSLSSLRIGPVRVLDTLTLLREVRTSDLGNALRSSMYNLVLEAATRMQDNDLIKQVEMQMRQDRVSITHSTQRMTGRKPAQHQESKRFTEWTQASTAPRVEEIY